MDPEKKILYHYTTTTGLIGILERKCLWASYFRAKNDFTELIYAKDVMLKSLENKDKGSRIINQLKQICDALYEKDLTLPFLFSFCDDHGDRLSQWRGYSDDGGGYSIGFDTDLLIKCIKEENKNFHYPHLQLSNVSYCKDSISDDLQYTFDKLLNVLENDDGSFEYYYNNIIEPFLKCYLKIKHKGFEEEQEFRLTALIHKKADPPMREIKFRIGRQGTPIPYIEILNDVHLAIHEIVIGPGRDSQHREEYILKMLLDKDGLIIPIRRSSIPFIT
jgi:hypothetical protein